MANATKPRPKSQRGQVRPRPATRRPRAASAHRENMTVGHKPTFDPRLATLALLCAAWSRWIEATAKVKQYGLLIAAGGSSVTTTDKKGKSVVTKKGLTLKANPAVSIAEKAAREVAALLAEFGMSPASRSRVSGTPAAAAKPANHKAKYFRGT